MGKAKVFLILCLSFIFGIVFASFIKTSFSVCYFLSLLILIFLILGWRNKKVRILSLSLIFLILGILRYNLSLPKLTAEKIQFYNSKRVIFQGIVKKIDERLNREELVIGSEKIVLNEAEIKIKGKVLVFVPLYSQYRYGDRLEINCQLIAPKSIERFAYHEYLARYNIYSSCFPKEIKILERNKGSFITRQILKIKEKIKLAINQNFTEPEGAIFSALLLGFKKEVPPKVREVFSKTGTAHILAVSGLHVMIMAKLLLVFCISIFSLKRQDAFWLISLMLIFYVILTGASASAVRAGIMGFLLILAEKIGRRKESLNLIVFAAATMLLFNPKLLKNDLGFQLSYLGILGITYLENFFYQFFKWLPKKKVNLRRYLATTLGAQIFVFPLVLYYWGNLSLGAPMANLLVLTVLPTLMALSFIFALGSLIFFWLGKILFFPVWLILFCLNKILAFLSRVPLFSLSFGQIHFLIVIFLYLAIIFFIIQVRKRYAKI